MKRVFFILLALFTVTLVATLLAHPRTTGSGSIYISADEGQPLADSVMKIVKTSCMDCHADGGNGMACSHVNFSKWSTYKPEKQASKAGDICKVLSKGAMPPKKYRENNPDAVPTPAQVATVCNWAKGLEK
jgi:hypothetical protein